MKPRRALCVVLAEDAAAGLFLQRYVRKLRSVRDIRLLPPPAGKGAGEQYVRSQYPSQVHELRRGLVTRSLVVHVDADTRTVEQRRGELADALQQAREERRGDDERIALIIPRRNIETWIHGLCGVDVDEEYNFKKDPEKRIGGRDEERIGVVSDRSRAAAEALFALTRDHTHATPPPSLPALVEGVQELRRLEE